MEQTVLLAYCSECGAPQGKFADLSELRVKIADRNKCSRCGAEFSFLKDGKIWNLWWETIRSGESNLTTIERKFSKLLDIEFSEFFYDSLKTEINKTYNFGLFTSTMLLSRKLLENLAIDILRIKYPQNQPGNLELYYDKTAQRFHDFTILLKNLEDKKDDFAIDTQIVSEFISLVKPFRPRANSNAHSIIIASDEEEVLKYKIPIMVALLLRLWNNLKS